MQSFTARMPLLMATRAFGVGRRRWSSSTVLNSLFSYLRYRTLAKHYKLQDNECKRQNMTFTDTRQFTAATATTNVN